MNWIIPSKSLTNRDKRFLEQCKDDAINKSISIIDETDPRYLPVENSPIIPLIEEHTQVKKKKYSKQIGILEYINPLSKEHEETHKKEIITVPVKRRKKKKLY